MVWSLLFRDIIDSIVLDWINKYPLEGQGSLSMQSLPDSESVRHWVAGVWGRITHQLASSGLPFNDRQILSIASRSFHTHLESHRWYNEIKSYLPEIK